MLKRRREFHCRRRPPYFKGAASATTAAAARTARGALGTMSRSLRTRRMTLYQTRDGDETIPSVPPVHLDAARGQWQTAPPAGESSYDAAPSGSRLSVRQGGPETRRTSVAGKRGTALSKASEVGINLKRRLSMRYAEPTELDDRGFSAVPDVPPLPSVIPGAPDLPPSSTAVGRASRAEAGEYGAGVRYDTNGQPLPVMGDGFADEEGGQELVGMDDAVAEARAQDPFIHGRTSLDSRKIASNVLLIDGIASDPMLDLEMLSSDKFNPEEYLKLKLAGSSETFLRDFQDSLRNAKDAASSDLKRQVFRNYQEFITISKEIATLENDMLELKELLGEWRTLPQALELEEGGVANFGSLADSALRGRSLRGNRNSMIDLQQIYKAQIQSLWENIEGSQKFLPLKQGRHLIAEASSFTELNAATYKPRQQVAFFLLNDLILVAVRKKRQMSARVRLVAERCFTLEEIIVIDLKDGGDLTNAIKIKQGKESFVYRTERSEDKRALLSAFRRVAEELANKRRKKNQAAAEARKHESGNLGVSGEALGGRRLSDDAGMTHSTGESDGTAMSAANKDIIRALTELTDNIAVSVALREWGEAVSLIEQGQARMAQSSTMDGAHRDFAMRLRSLTSQLVESVSYDLSSPLLKKSSVVRDVGHLLRLDRGERAREIFLNSRSELLKRRSRQIKFEGDVSLYISELALVHFTLIKNTSEWYMSAFKDNHMASGFVRWAVAQIEAYAEIFRRQVYGMVDQDPRVVSEAIDITMGSAAQLKEVGLDLMFALRELLSPEGSGTPGAVAHRAPAVGGHSSVPSLTVTLADDPDAMAKRLSAIDLRQQSISAKSPRWK